MLDQRSVYLLHIPNEKIICSWIGKLCPDIDSYVRNAEEYAKWMIEYEPACKNCKLVRIKSKEVSEIDSNNKNSIEAIFWKNLCEVNVDVSSF